MVGDGSYDDILGFGAGAFILSNSDMSQFIIGGGPTPGPMECQNSYHSELGTILGMGIMASIMEEITKSSPIIIVACDNDQVLIRSFLPSCEQIKANQRSSDLLSTIHDIWKITSVQASPTFVKGHADTLGRELTKVEQLNTIVDQKAKEFLRQRPSGPVHRLFNEKHGMSIVEMRGTQITGTIAKSIQKEQQKERSIKAGIWLSRFTAETFQFTDQVALQRAMTNMSYNRKLFITKWVSHQLPVGKRMKERKHFLHDNCPICNTYTEDVPHLLLCPHQQVRTFYQTQLNNLLKWGQKVQTDNSAIAPDNCPAS